MKKIVSFILFVFMIINTSISFAEFTLDTKLSVQKQNAYKKQIDKVYKNLDNKLSKLSEEKQISNIEILVKKIDKLLLNKLSDKNNFVLSYLNYLLKENLNLLQEKIKEKEEKELLKKQSEEIKTKKLSSDERPIGTIEITASNYSYFNDKHLVYEIITTNNIVKGYELSKNLKTGKFNTESYDFTKLENGFYDSKTGEIYVAYHRYRYENIMVDLMTFDNSFIIKGTDVYYGNSKIGIFYPNQLQIQKQDDIPLTQGCSEYWSDNTSDKIYYDKNSKFYNNILNKTNYNDDYLYFCSEDEAIKEGYKKSVN